MPKHLKHKRISHRKVLESPSKKLSREWLIWDMYADDVPIYVIAKKLGLHCQTVQEQIDTTWRERSGELGEMVRHRRTADLEKIAKIIKAHSENAVKPYLEETKVSADGHPFLVKNYEQPIKSANLVLDAIEQRSRIMGYDRPEQEGKSHEEEGFKMFLQQIVIKDAETPGKSEPIDIESVELLCDAEA